MLRVTERSTLGRTVIGKIILLPRGKFIVAGDHYCCPFELFIKWKGTFQVKIKQALDLEVVAAGETARMLSLIKFFFKVGIRV